MFEWIFAILDSRRACVTAQSCARNHLDMISKHEVHIQIVSTESDKLLYLQSPNTCCFLAGDKPTTLSGSGRHLSGPVNCFFCQKTRYFSWNVETLACADHVNARIQIRLRDYYLCYLVDYTFCSPLYSQVASHPSTSLHICRIGQTSRPTVPASC